LSIDVKLSTRRIGKAWPGSWQNRTVIHDENPFAPTDDDPLRRFRGRLASPVTIITAGSADTRTGLTVSSLFVAEGDAPLLFALVGPNSDLFDEVSRSGAFVVHIGQSGQEGIAEVFAGLRPSPGGLFRGLEVEQGEWGPVLAAIPNRAFCTFKSIEPQGWTGLLVGAIDRFELAGDPDPLIHFRGRYRTLG
jgi:flavin reductase (DIM6/NTAB) family NADH-FMN oxidoreductase RutF